MAFRTSKQFDYVFGALALVAMGWLGWLGWLMSTAPHHHHMHEVTPEEFITNNLRQIAAAGQQYILEEGVYEVRYQQMVGYYFAPIQQIQGETYDQLIVHQGGGTLHTESSDGLAVTFTYDAR